MSEDVNPRLIVCPFCGGQPEVQINGPTSVEAQHMISMGEDWDVSYYVACQCTATGPESVDEVTAIQKWNERPALREAIDVNIRMRKASEGVAKYLREILEVLKREAPGTKLNNHKFVQIGISAYNALSAYDGEL